jgi:hypothetical protein
VADPELVAKARAWLVSQGVPSTQTLASVFAAMYADGFLTGVKGGYEALDSSAPASELTAIISATDWDKWTPGSPQTAALLDNGGFKALLDSADITIQGVDGTTLDRMAAILANSIANGDNMATTAKALGEVVDSESRAMMIARTETARAMVAGSMTAYRDAGIEQWNWLPGECALCLDRAAGSPYSMDDDTPPLHPGCTCAVSPISMPSLTVSDAGDDE